MAFTKEMRERRKADIEARTAAELAGHGVPASSSLGAVPQSMNSAVNAEPSQEGINRITPSTDQLSSLEKTFASAGAQAMLASDGPKSDTLYAPTSDAAGEAPPKVTRATRVPFGNMTQKLALPKRAGYHRHWFTDKPGRIDEALQAGYTFIQDAAGKNLTRVVGTGPGGIAEIGFAMEIPQEWRDEDVEKAQQKLTADEEQMRRGQVQSKNPADAKNFYAGSEGRGISITHSRVR